MTNRELDLLTSQVEKLNLEEKRLLIERILALIAVQEESLEDAINEDLVLSDEEVVELLTPKEPMTGKQMVEAGIIGGWEHKNIEDSAEWLAQQRDQRRKKINW